MSDFEPGKDEAYPCEDCNGATRTWFAPNGLWNEVMGGPDGMLCPSCFILRAEKIGMVPTAWVLTMERPSRYWSWSA